MVEAVVRVEMVKEEEEVAAAAAAAAGWVSEFHPPCLRRSMVKATRPPFVPRRQLRLESRSLALA